MEPIPIRAVDLDAGVIEGLAIPFGGPLEGRDLEGETFTKDTDLHLDWFPSGRPLLYGHGRDDTIKGDVVGRQTTVEIRDEGIWIEGQLNMAHKYAGAIRKLLGKSVLYFSSGAIPHLVKANTAGEITNWPWAELSLTPAPMNPYAIIDAARTVKHYRVAGLELPEVAIKKPDPIEHLWLVNQRERLLR